MRREVTPTEPAAPADVGVEVAFPIEDAAAFRDRLRFAVADAGGGCAGGYLASTADDQPPDIFQQIEVEGACAATAAFPSAEDLPQ